tara:strand:- start:313 stop:873 length:561 start_codon:yes stop_codon:yes gene_type:complete
MVDIDDLRLANSGPMLSGQNFEVVPDDLEWVYGDRIFFKALLDDSIKEGEYGKAYKLEDSEWANDIFMVGEYDSRNPSRAVYLIQTKVECFEYGHTFKFIECRVKKNDGKYQFTEIQRAEGGYFENIIGRPKEGYFAWDCDGESIWLLKSLSGVNVEKIPFLNWRENPFEPKQQDLGFEGLGSLFN